MSLVQRSPMTNHRGTTAKGIVRFITKKGISVNYDSSYRPVGNGSGQPDINRASKEVQDGAKGSFNRGKGITRNSVYAGNNS